MSSSAAEDVIIIGSEDEADEQQRSSKRALDTTASVSQPAKKPHLDSGPHDQGGGAAGPNQSRQQGGWVAPFQLLKVQGIPDYANRPPTGVRLRDVVCGEMEYVLVSNYMVDMTWLLSACPDLKRAGFLQVVHGESEPMIVRLMKEEAKLAGLTLGERFSIHAPPLPIPYGTHHSKAFIIVYKTGLRVVVHTANLVHCDNNHKSQGLWVQDFPLKDEGSAPSSPFETDLVEYLRHLQIPSQPAIQSVIVRCKAHDFSSARVHLIHSRPGRHPNGVHVGHMALRNRLKQEEFDSSFVGSPVFAQFSSLGSLDQKWLHQEFQAGTLSAGRTAPVSGGARTLLGCAPHNASGLHLIWPTVDEVRNSLEGWAAGRSIPGFTKNVSKPFLHPHWHRFGGETAGRQRAMPHIKTFGRYRVVPGKGTQLAWFCLTSHNLSKAAWGALQAGQTLMVRSYELGVLFLPSLESAYRAHRHCGFTCTETSPIKLPIGMPNANVEFWAKEDPSQPDDAGNAMFLPLPYKLPPRVYESGDQPWMADAGYPGLDAYGRRRDQDFPPLYGFTQD